MPPQPTPAAKPAKAEPFTPFVYSDKGVRDAMIQHLKEFKPEGHPDPVQLENARTFALAELVALPEEFNFVRITIESNPNSRGRQTNVILFGDTVRT